MPIEMTIPRTNLVRATFLSPLISLGFAAFFSLGTFLIILTGHKPWEGTIRAFQFAALFSAVGYFIGLLGSVLVGLPLFKLLDKYKQHFLHYYLLGGLIGGSFVLGLLIDFLIFQRINPEKSMNWGIIFFCGLFCGDTGLLLLEKFNQGH